METILEKRKNTSWVKNSVKRMERKKNDVIVYNHVLEKVLEHLSIAFCQ